MKAWSLVCVAFILARTTPVHPPPPPHHPLPPGRKWHTTYSTVRVQPTQNIPYILVLVLKYPSVLVTLYLYECSSMVAQMTTDTA